MCATASIYWSGYGRLAFRRRSAAYHPAIDKVYDAAGTVYDFYKTVFDRNSINDRGLHLVSSVHYSTDFDNAFRNGQQMVYGDGDGEIFGRFTSCLDIIGHELTHGIAQYGADFDDEGQSGALDRVCAATRRSRNSPQRRSRTPPPTARA